jgi:hypothetical protein
LEHVIPVISPIILITGFYPVWQAWQMNRQTSLVSTIAWLMATWLFWVAALATYWLWPHPLVRVLYYAAISLTACSGISALGARQPITAMWNVVVFALWVILMTACLERGFISGDMSLKMFQFAVLGITLGFGILNYLPTTSFLAGLVLAAGVGFMLNAFQFKTRSEGGGQASLMWGGLAIACVPWVAYLCLKSKSKSGSKFDRMWLSFRDRYGMVWAEGLRKQFNAGAKHSLLPVVLSWRGLRPRRGAVDPPTESQKNQIVSLIRRLMQRFVFGEM